MFVSDAERIKQPRNNKDKGVIIDIHPRAEHLDRAACLRYRQRPQLRPAQKMDRWVVDDTPAIRSDLDYAPAVVRKIQVNSPIATDDANIDLALRALEGAALQHADDRAESCRRRHPTRALVMMPLKPPAKLVTPEWQTLAMAADHETDKCLAVPRVEEFAAPEIFLGFPLSDSDYWMILHNEFPVFRQPSMRCRHSLPPAAARDRRAWPLTRPLGTVTPGRCHASSPDATLLEI
jgi:hypothetical protein